MSTTTRARVSGRTRATRERCSTATPSRTTGGRASSTTKLCGVTHPKQRFNRQRVQDNQARMTKLPLWRSPDDRTGCDGHRQHDERQPQRRCGSRIQPRCTRVHAQQHNCHRQHDHQLREHRSRHQRNRGPSSPPSDFDDNDYRYSRYLRQLLGVDQRAGCRLGCLAADFGNDPNGSLTTP